MPTFYRTEQVLNKAFDSTNGALYTETVGSSSNTAVQRMSAGFMAPGQTAKQYTGYQVLSTSPTSIALETVTASKSYYITDMLIVTDYPNGTGTLDIQIQAAGTPIFRGGAHNLVPIDLPGMETQPFATTGQAVTLNVSAATASYHVWFWISGFEQ